VNEQMTPNGSAKVREEADRVSWCFIETGLEGVDGV